MRRRANRIPDLKLRKDSQTKSKRERGKQRKETTNLDLLAVDFDMPSAKLDTDGQVMDRLKSLICELKEEATLTDALSW